MTLAPLEEHELSHIRIDELKFDQSNPNTLTDEQMEALRKSMKKFGYLTPIIVDQNNMIADGEHRALIYKEFGFSEIPCFKVKLKDDIERRMLRQVMNKLHGEHDRQRDANELLQIFESKQLDELAELIAQPKEGLESILTKYHGIEFQHEDNFDSKLLEDFVPVTKLGDIWQLGNHRIICADCSDQKSLNKLLENNQAKLLLTDPPYGVDIINTELGTTDGAKPITIGYLRSSYAKAIHIKGSDHKALASRQYRQIQGDASPFDPRHLIGMAKNHIIFGGNYFADSLPSSSGWLVWLKKHEDWERTTFADCELIWTDFQIPARVYRIVWMGIVRQGDHSDRVHPTQKPINLMSLIVQDFSEEQDIILDPYLGSGSTLIACEQTNRICYGVEIDPHYCDVIVKRWEQYTGKTAQKCN